MSRLCNGCVQAVWWLILNGVILNVRPRKSAHAYAQVWGPDGSPLATITKSQAEALQARVSAGKLTEAARDATLANLHIAPTLQDFAPCDLVIEAIIEKLGLRK